MRKQFLQVLLDSKKTFFCLLFANVLVSLFVFIYFRNVVSGDEGHYLNFAEGFKHGRYSHWWFLPNYIPDTFRTPGYPFFLYILQLIYDNIYFLKSVQLALYFISVILLLTVAGRIEPGFRLKNIFLLLLLPYLQVVYFTVNILPEALMSFLLTLYLYLDTMLPEKKRKYILLGVLSGIIFMVRPVFLFFPFLSALIKSNTERKKNLIIYNITMVAVFFLTIMPYGFWNLKQHKVFSITPIEGAGGVFQLGYWCFKMPGYTDKRYWKNILSDEIISFTDSSEINKNIQAYNKEWDYIDSACVQYLTAGDSLALVQMNAYPMLFKTYSTKYTMEREHLLKKLTFQHFLNDPVFTIKTKIYTVFRLWFSGIQKKDSALRNKTEKFGVIYFSVVSFIVLLISILFIPLAYFKRRIKWHESKTMIMLILYFGLMHVPFAIQARYTIPVRLILLLLLSVSIIRLIRLSNTSNSA